MLRGFPPTISILCWPWAGGRGQANLCSNILVLFVAAVSRGLFFLFQVVGAIPCFGEGRREQDLAIHFVWFLFRGAAGGGSW